MSLKGQAQYWVRADITIADGDDVGDALLELQIRINGTNIIDLQDMQDGNSNTGGRNATVNQAYSGSFPNQIQFFDSASGLGFSGGIGQVSLCPDAGNFTNNVPTNNGLFFGPFDGGSGTYFNCDQILQSGTQFFQVWRLNNLPQPNDNTFCPEETILLDPNNFGASIRTIDYQTNLMNSFTNLISFFPSTAGSYEVDLSTIPNIESVSNITFRLNYGNGIFTSANYIIIDCSPEIIDIEIENPLCAEGDNSQGTFTVTFEEALNGDVLSNIGVFSAGPNGIFDGPGSIINDDILEDAVSTNIVVTGIQFTYPNSLPEGTYKFRYQTNGSDSVQESDEFTIIAPPPLDYEVVIESEISCFDEENGSVRININPNNDGNIGTPGYQYTRSDNPGTCLLYTSPSPRD